METRPYSRDLCTGLENQDKLLQRALEWYEWSWAVE